MRRSKRLSPRSTVTRAGRGNRRPEHEPEGDEDGRARNDRREWSNDGRAAYNRWSTGHVWQDVGRHANYAPIALRLCRRAARAHDLHRPDPIYLYTALARHGANRQDGLQPRAVDLVPRLHRGDHDLERYRRWGGGSRSTLGRYCLPPGTSPAVSALPLRRRSWRAIDALRTELERGRAGRAGRRRAAAYRGLGAAAFALGRTPRI